MNDFNLENFLRAVEFSRLLEILAQNCQTPAGREAVIGLRPLTEERLLRERLDRTQKIEKHMAAYSTPPIPHPGNFKEAFDQSQSAGKVLSAEEISALLRFLSGVVKLRQYLSPEATIFADWLERLQSLPDLKEFLSRKVSEQGQVLDSASAELKSVRDRLKTLRSEVQDYYRQFLQKMEPTEALQEKIVTEREGRLVVPVKRDHQSQVPGFVHGFSGSGATIFVEPQEIVERNSQVRETLLRED
ncbi:MAG: hypothetical protein ACREL1_04050, partial [bacterium]